MIHIFKYFLLQQLINYAQIAKLTPSIFKTILRTALRKTAQKRIKYDLKILPHYFDFEYYYFHIST